MSERVEYSCDGCGSVIADAAPVLSVNLFLRGGYLETSDGKAVCTVRHFCVACRVQVLGALDVALHVEASAEKAGRGDA